MRTEMLVLLVIHESGGRLQGKTLLQKRIYFLSKLLGIDLGYQAHYYGPYSPQVEEALAQAKGLGFVAEQTLGFGMGDGMGFEVRRYDYTLTDDGRQVVGRLRNLMPGECAKIRDALASLREAGDTGDYVSLSVAAKTHHVLTERNAPMMTDDIRAAAEEFGWTIGPDAIDKAISFLARLELARQHGQQ